MSEPVTEETTTLRINGRRHRFVAADADTPLLFFLRNELLLMSPRYGCGVEQCGACMVLLDGEPTPSCRMPVAAAAERDVTTVEGSAAHRELRAVQHAFAEANALQCGYCVSGIMIAAAALLRRTPSPTRRQVQTALARNLCRCGAHDRMLRAVDAAAGSLQEDGSDRQAASPPPAAAAAAAALPPAAPQPQPQPQPPPPPPPPPPRALERSPLVSDWLHFSSQGHLTVLSGKVELGQGLCNALTAICSEELELSADRISVVTGDTARTPDEGVTAGSGSMEQSGASIRLAAATARAELLARGAAHLGVSADRLQLGDGAVRRCDDDDGDGDGDSVSVELLLRGEQIERRIDPHVQCRAAGRPAPSPAGARAHARNITVAKPWFVHDLRPPGLVHGRVVRPPGQGYRLAEAATESVQRYPGVLAVLVDGSFVGVVAEREQQAIAAAALLAELTRWRAPPQPVAPDHHAALGSTTPATAVALDRHADTTADPRNPGAGDAPSTAAPGGSLTCRYSRPYLLHAALGPSAALAHLDAAGELTVWSHTQGPFPLRAALAGALEVAEDSVRVIHTPGAGCYGHNGADDVALDAALLAGAVVGRPVLVQWSRADEHRWEPFGTATEIELRGAISAGGAITAWQHQVWSHTHSSRPRAAGGDHSSLLAAAHRAQPLAPPTPQASTDLRSGALRNAEPLYALPQVRIVNHFVADAPFRVSALRSLGAFANVFAIESFVDELAAAAGLDPVQLRLQHLTDPRARAVLEHALTCAPSPTAARGSGEPPVPYGRGVAIARYKNLQTVVAVVCDLRVDPTTGGIRLQHATLAADAGRVIDADGLINQLEGGFIQAASWTLTETVRWDATGVTRGDWDGYPILRFPDVPRLAVHLIDRPGTPSVGAGEAAHGPTPAAIANAVFAATGLRLRDTPFTPARVLAGLAALDADAAGTP